MVKTTLRRTSALVLGLALVGAACGGDNKSSTSATTTATTATAASAAPSSAPGSSASSAAGAAAASPIGSGTTCPKGIALGFFGALTGDNANLGINIKNGASLALEQWNKANPDCQVTLKDFDSQGDPKQAPALAQKAASDKDVVGIVGPAFSGESKAADPTFNEAGLPLITASATNPDLSKNGWTVFHRMLATDAKQGPDVANYIKNTLKGTKVLVIDDQSEYGKGIADEVRKTLGAVNTDNDSIDPKATDYSATVTKAKNADVIFYGGYYSDAGKLVKQMRDGGVTAKFVSGDGSVDPGLVKAGGPAAEDVYLSCPCNLNGNDAFLSAFKAKFNDDPRTYGAEAYDSANSFFAALKAGKFDRKGINDFLKTYSAPGVSREIKWDDKGEIGQGPTYIFVVKNGVITKLDTVS